MNTQDKGFTLPGSTRRWVWHRDIDMRITNYLIAFFVVATIAVVVRTPAPFIALITSSEYYAKLY